MWDSDVAQNSDREVEREGFWGRGKLKEETELDRGKERRERREERSIRRFSERRRSSAGFRFACDKSSFSRAKPLSGHRGVLVTIFGSWFRLD